MNFGLEKSVKVTFVRGMRRQAASMKLDTKSIIKELEIHENYKYLGINEGDTIHNSTIKLLR